MRKFSFNITITKLLALAFSAENKLKPSLVQTSLLPTAHFSAEPKSWTEVVSTSDLAPKTVNKLVLHATKLYLLANDGYGLRLLVPERFHALS